VEFILLFIEERGADPDPSRMPEMTAFSGSLADSGKLRRGAPLAHEAESVRVRVRDERALVHDGPFAEAKEVLGGFFVVDVASRAEAIEIAKRAPHARFGTVEVHAILRRHLFADAGEGKPWLFAFRLDDGDCVEDGDRMKEMVAFGESLAGSGKLFETTPLAADPPPARVEVRGGAALVVDGPFAEAKEAVGGYSFVRAADAAEALAIAKRYPHARWGTVEVREILFFDRVSS
jgi:hypothetical protein